jgi:hypothetical protein
MRAIFGKTQKFPCESYGSMKGTHFPTLRRLLFDRRNLGASVEFAITLAAQDPNHRR